MNSPTEYMLRVAADEIEHLERQSLPAFPHVERFINRPTVKFVLRHLQNFCWTMERGWGRIRRRYVPAQAVQPLNLRPDWPAGSLPTCPPRIWVDVTNTYRTGFGGGIGRVAMQLARTGAATGLALPVIIEDGRIRPYFRMPHAADDELHFDADVTYVIVDSFWQQTEEYIAICDQAHAAGASIVTCFHDVIPLYYPNFNRSAFAACFTKSFAEITSRSDACIAVSQYTARKVQTHVEAMNLRPDRPLPIAYFYLGADGHVSDRPRPVREKIRHLFACRNVFLSVGTLEPRKGYPITLDAFDKLWARGVDCSFVIIGRPGWISKSLEKRILEHPLAGTKLHWLADVEDAELAFAYRNAHCLIQSSITEGFGLPIVEANHEGTPVIAAETDVFRELAGNAITYFRNCDSDDLAAKIADAVHKRPDARSFDIPTWKESLAQMVEAIHTALAERATILSEVASAKSDHAVYARRTETAQIRVLNARSRANQSRRR